MLSSFEGGNIDVLNPVSIAALGTYTVTTYFAQPGTLPQVNLDYSATYGPIVVDPTTHRVYINDFGSATNLPPGLNPSPGFFVYDPNQSATVINNIQHVAGYQTSPTTTALFSAQALLVDNAGNLILVNQNTSISNNQGATYQSTPFTILHNRCGFQFLRQHQDRAPRFLSKRLHSAGHLRDHLVRTRQQRLDPEFFGDRWSRYRHGARNNLPLRL